MLIEGYNEFIALNNGYNSNKNFTLGGASNFDMSGSTGTLKGPTGVVDLSAASNLKLPASVTVTATPDFTPASDAVNAFEFTNAADSAIVLDIDTTNQRIGIGNGAATPGYTLDVQGSSAANCRVGILSANANAFNVGLTVANPAFSVDASTASQAAGLNVKGAATGGTVAIAAIDSGANTSVTLDGKGTGTLLINSSSATAGLVTIGNSTALGGTQINGATNITSISANSLSVGRQGATNPVLQIDASTASVATGISVKGGAVGTSPNIQVVSSGANEGLNIISKGTGGIHIQPGTDNGDAFDVRKADGTTVIFQINSLTSAFVGPAVGGLFQSAADIVNIWKFTKNDGTTTILSIDAANNRVGIGKATPATMLDVNGVITAASGTATPAGGSASGVILLGTTAALGIYYGSGAPTVSAAQGSIYIRTDGSSTSTRLYINTNGSTIWTNVTTAA